MERRAPLERDPEKVREWNERSRRKSAPRRRRPISAASPAQRQAVSVVTHCSACGKPRSSYRTLDPAHLAKRGSAGGCDEALCTPFALCRTSNGTGCHRDFDEGRLSLLAKVAAEGDRYREALQHALEHMGLVQLVERLAGAKTQWSDL